MPKLSFLAYFNSKFFVETDVLNYDANTSNCNNSNFAMISQNVINAAPLINYSIQNLITTIFEEQPVNFKIKIK